MSIQFEDVVDVVTTLHPDSIFLFLFNNSSVHGKKRIGGLDSGRVNNQFCSKASRNDIIKDSKRVWISKP